MRSMKERGGHLAGIQGRTLALPRDAQIVIGNEQLVSAMGASRVGGDESVVPLAVKEN